MKSKIGKVLTVLAVLVLIVLGCCRVYENKWLYDQPKFHGVTIELGEEVPGIEAFLTKYADPERVSLVTQDIDPTQVGEQTLVFKHISKEE